MAVITATMPLTLRGAMVKSMVVTMMVVMNVTRATTLAHIYGALTAASCCPERFPYTDTFNCKTHPLRGPRLPPPQMGKLRLRQAARVAKAGSVEVAGGDPVVWLQSPSRCPVPSA